MREAGSAASLVESRQIAAVLFATAVIGCGGQALEPVDARTDASASTDAVAQLAETIVGAEFQGDADQCATVVCSGGEVCCVVPTAWDVQHDYPNNKCDFDCQAQCMDQCPILSESLPTARSLSRRANTAVLWRRGRMTRR